MDNSTVRIRLDLAYDGTDFHGWAKQGTSDLRTVQKVLEDNLSMVLRETVELTVAGRTDAGVHAAGQVAHFDIPAHALEQRSIDGDPSKLFGAWVGCCPMIFGCMAYVLPSPGLMRDFPRCAGTTFIALRRIPPARCLRAATTRRSGQNLSN